VRLMVEASMAPKDNRQADTAKTCCASGCIERHGILQRSRKKWLIFSAANPHASNSFLLYLYDVEKALRRKLGPVDRDFVATLYRENLPVEMAVALLRQ
jgi:hypothetical protein